MDKENLNNRKINRDTGIELARILGCLIVVGVHTCLGITVSNHYDLSRTFIACIFADGVAIFWLITGCFLFKNSSYGKLLIKSIRSFVVPMMAFSFFSFYFSDWLIKGESLLESLTHTKEEYFEIIKKLLSWKNFAEYGGHLWYLYVYLLLIVLFPVLKSFVKYLDEDESRVRCFLLISLGMLLINDISQNQFAEFEHHAFRGVVPAAIEVIWGHILYKRREQLINKKYIINSIIIFVMLNSARTIIQMNRAENKYILYWYSSLGLICAICVLVFSMSFIETKLKNQKILNTVNNLASYTFSIYIIHPLVKAFFQRFNFQGNLMSHIMKSGNYWYSEILYSIIILIAVFLVSLLIVIIIKAIVKRVKLLGNSTG